MTADNEPHGPNCVSLRTACPRCVAAYDAWKAADNEPPVDDGLAELLALARKIEGTSEWGSGVATCYPRNPEGSALADRIEALAAANQRLSAAIASSDENVARLAQAIDAAIARAGDDYPSAQILVLTVLAAIREKADG